MELTVIVAGIADPKWPLPAPPLELEGLRRHTAAHPALSPFDEAALELALKARDALPEARVHAIVAADEAMARRVAGWRPDTLHRLAPHAAPWDSHAVAQALADTVRATSPQSSLLLVGREFGDFDDGTVPALLAAALGVPHVPLALGLQQRPGAWWALRQCAGGLERVKLPPRALLSVTNDVGNRLRHPLMKNVMAARKAQIGVHTAAGGIGAASALEAVRAAVAPARTRSCEWIAGTAGQQAEALARLLAPEHGCSAPCR